MNENRTGGDADGTAEPSLTQKNSETVRGEETLADDGTAETNVEDTSTRTKLGAVPSSYGAPGGLLDEGRRAGQGGPGGERGPVAGGGSEGSEE